MHIEFNSEEEAVEFEREEAARRAAPSEVNPLTCAICILSEIPHVRETCAAPHELKCSVSGRFADATAGCALETERLARVVMCGSVELCRRAHERYSGTEDH